MLETKIRCSAASAGSVLGQITMGCFLTQAVYVAAKNLEQHCGGDETRQ
ncbi:MAG: hypothetical protein M3209_20570 [Acidobacteriota bacterium]|nr:hypothetical protein [Acidobacteriota bacterium]